MARVTVDGVGISYEIAGEGRPVLLLHGFPDTGACWRHQVPALVDAGFQVIVPDLRGYGDSDKPADVAAYSLPFLAGDVLGVLDDLGIQRAHVVGHDWGAALAWVLASLVADRVDQLVVLSVGHPSGFLRTLEQREKSWYMLLFQFEGVAEHWLSDDDWANFKDWAHHPDPEVTTRLEADGSLTPALNYYRANLSPETWIAPPAALGTVAASTMGVWSTGDMALTEVQMTDSRAHVTGPWRYERIEGAGHWLQLEAPRRVNELLVDFLER
ncbi:MAG TPA: alpha/beta hydrolase [Acidimicrobiales bacterium]|jgi:pimeloyl-ACP methyl ester carboxylesterase|nr:alpha/beta hydrolase [Acidimicrobiales bacterium]